MIADGSDNDSPHQSPVHADGSGAGGAQSPKKPTVHHQPSPFNKQKISFSVDSLLSSSNARKTPSPPPPLTRDNVGVSAGCPSSPEDLRSSRESPSDVNRHSDSEDRTFGTSGGTDSPEPSPTRTAVPQPIHPAVLGAVRPHLDIGVGLPPSSWHLPLSPFAWMPSAYRPPSPSSK